MADAEKINTKLKTLKKLSSKISLKKKIGIGLVLLVGVLLGVNSLTRNSNVNGTPAVKSIVASVDKSYEFPALNNQGKPVSTKIKMKLVKAEKTDQVFVKDQAFTAKNKKLFFILNLELKNDATTQVNLQPGDLVRVTYNGDEDNKYAPDLHNNLVPVSAISTKIDRVGFVVPQEVKEFKVYVGELEGKKEVVTIAFPS